MSTRTQRPTATTAAATATLTRIRNRTQQARRATAATIPTYWSATLGRRVSIPED